MGHIYSVLFEPHEWRGPESCPARTWQEGRANHPKVLRRRLAMAVPKPERLRPRQLATTQAIARFMHLNWMLSLYISMQISSPVEYFISPQNTAVANYSTACYPCQQCNNNNAIDKSLNTLFNHKNNPKPPPLAYLSNTFCNYKHYRQSSIQSSISKAWHESAPSPKSSN